MDAEYRALVWPASSGSVMISEDAFTAVSVTRWVLRLELLAPCATPNLEDQGRSLV